MNRLGGGQKLLGLILLPVVLGCGTQPNAPGNANGQPGADTSSWDAGAQTFSRDSVRRFLKYPDDADFNVSGTALGFPMPDTMGWNGDRTNCRCSGKVKAKNALGAALTHNWEVLIRRDGTNWQLVSCKIDDALVFADGAAVNGMLSEAAEKRKVAEGEAKVQRQAVQAQEQAEIEERKWHKWTSSDGQYTVDAKFGGMEFKVVKLVKRDGTFVKLPLEKLSADDQEFINKRKWDE